MVITKPREEKIAKLVDGERDRAKGEVGMRGRAF